MKALSLTPWWAAIVAAGLKPVENRKWPTSFRGEFYLHASLGKAEHQYEVLEFLMTSRQRLSPSDYVKARDIVDAGAGVRRGGIIGRATLVDCITASDSPWFFGPYGFVLENVRAVPFVACKGSLGFFGVPADVLAKIGEAA